MILFSGKAYPTAGLVYSSARQVGSEDRRPKASSMGHASLRERLRIKALHHGKTGSMPFKPLLRERVTHLRGIDRLGKIGALA